MGPKDRYHGPRDPVRGAALQDPVPAVDHELVSDSDIAELKKQVLATGVSVTDLVWTAWAAASSFRGSDKRGGVNGGRIRLEPPKSWEVNEPGRLAPVVAALEGVQASFNAAQTGRERSPSPTSSSSAAPRRSRRRRRTPATPSPSRSTRAAPTPRRSRPTSSRSSWMEPQTEGFRNYPARAATSPRSSLSSTRPTCSASAPRR